MENEEALAPVSDVIEPKKVRLTLQFGRAGSKVGEKYGVLVEGPLPTPNSINDFAEGMAHMVRETVLQHYAPRSYRMAKEGA